MKTSLFEVILSELAQIARGQSREPLLALAHVRLLEEILIRAELTSAEIAEGERWLRAADAAVNPSHNPQRLYLAPFDAGKLNPETTKRLHAIDENIRNAHLLSREVHVGEVKQEVEDGSLSSTTAPIKNRFMERFNKI